MGLIVDCFREERSVMMNAPGQQGGGAVEMAVHKQLILLLAKYCGLFAVSRWLTARKIRILAWHGVWLGESHFGNFLYISEEKFSRRLELLEKWGYPILPLSEVLDCANEGKLPAGSTAITIDDGWFGTYRFMLPALERHNYPATVYLTTYYCAKQTPVIDVALAYFFHAVDAGRCPELHIPDFNYGPVSISTPAQRERALALAFGCIAELRDESQKQEFLQALCKEMNFDFCKIMSERWFHLMSPLEVADAAKRGLRFELHTHRHRISYAGKDCLAAEIELNRTLIEDIANQGCNHFCYPSGIFSIENWPVLKRCNIWSATTTRVGLVDNNSSRYALPRILDGERVSELEFEAEMSGFVELTRKLRISLSEVSEKLFKFGTDKKVERPS